MLRPYKKIGETAGLKTGHYEETGTRSVGTC